MKIYIPAVVVMIGLMSGAVQAEDGPSKDVPQLKVLDYYTGQWESTFSIPSPDDPTQVLKFKGKVTVKWILGGRFVQQTGIYKAGENEAPISFTTLYTYDVKKQAYRNWSFNSSGESSESEGKWDETAKAMIWKGVDVQSQMAVEMKSDHSKSDVNPWSIDFKTQDDQTVFTISGNNKRIKK